MYENTYNQEGVHNNRSKGPRDVNAQEDMNLILEDYDNKMIVMENKGAGVVDDLTKNDGKNEEFLEPRDADDRSSTKNAESFKNPNRHDSSSGNCSASSNDQNRAGTEEPLDNGWTCIQKLGMLE